MMMLMISLQKGFSFSGLPLFFVLALHRSRNLLFDKGSRDEFGKKECCEQHLKYSKRMKKKLLARNGSLNVKILQNISIIEHMFVPLHHSYLAFIKRLTRTSECADLLPS